ncbi:protein SLC31A2 isoform X1 [Camelus dromedarius]
MQGKQEISRPCLGVSQEHLSYIWMHFIFSDEVVLLFDFWKVHSPTGMALSVLVVLLLAVLFESIKVGKVRLLHQALASLPIPTSQQLIEETDQDSSNSDSPPVSRSHLRWFLCHFGQSLLHVTQVVIGYFMMLAVMSYNTWIFFGVVLGSGVGYYLAYPLLSMT